MGPHIRNKQLLLGTTANMGSPHRSAELGLIPKNERTFFAYLKTTKLLLSVGIKTQFTKAHLQAIPLPYGNLLT